jgi:hypothetical protein
MAARITGSVGSYESGAKNNTADITTVQTLLTQAAQKKHQAAFDPNGIDGKISRTASRSGTVKAIGNFQRIQVGMRNVDFRIDVGGKTWQTLVAAAGPATAPPVTQRPVAGMITLTVKHGNKIPKVTTGVTPTETTLYESTFTLSGGLTGTFRGSIYPDDMNVKGRLVDGTYPLHIGFHKGGGKPKLTAADLVHRTQGVRAGLLVNARNSVPVSSNSASKTTSVGINVHNGFRQRRYSDGCLTLHPDDWKKFIEKILAAYPNIADWHTIGANTGKKIGSVVIGA